MFEDLKMTSVQQQIVDALPEWTDGDDDKWATRVDVANALGVAVKTVGNNIAKLTAAGVLEKTLADDNRTALYRVAQGYLAHLGKLGEPLPESHGEPVAELPPYEPQPHQHVWIAGMVYVDDDDVEQVAAQRPVKCEDCDEPYRLTTDPGSTVEIVTADDFAPTGLDGDSPACDCPRQADKRLMHAADCAIVLWEAQRICPWENGWRAPEAVVEICAEAVKPCPVHKPAETAAEPSEPQGVAEGTPAPVSAGSGALGDVLAFMQSVRPVSAPPAPEPRARRQRADGERPAWRVFAPGQLNAEVAAFLANLDAAQQQDGVTPTVVAKALNAQVGSVAFACMKLTERGAARQTSDKPKRYAAPA